MDLITVNIQKEDELRIITDLVTNKFGKKKYVGVFDLNDKYYCIVLDKIFAKVTFVTLDNLRQHVEKNLYEINIEKQSIKKVSKSSINKLFENLAKKIILVLLIGMCDDKIARLSIGNDILESISVYIEKIEGGVKIENKILLEKLFNS